MKSRSEPHCCWKIPASALVAVFVGALAVGTAPTVNAAPAFSHAAAEPAIGGVTVREQAAQHAALRAQLVADMPSGVLAAPIHALLLRRRRMRRW